MVGEVFRVSEEEQKHLLSSGNLRGGASEGSYLLAPTNPLRHHAAMVESLIAQLLMPSRLARQEMHFSQISASGRSAFDTFDILNAIAFGKSDIGTHGLVYPLPRSVQSAVSTDHNESCSKVVALPANYYDISMVRLLESFGRDHLRCEARLHFAIAVNNLAQDDSNLTSIRAGAHAFIGEIAYSMRMLGLNGLQHVNGVAAQVDSAAELPSIAAQLSPVARAHWALFLAALEKQPQSDNPFSGLLSFASGSRSYQSHFSTDRQFSIKEDEETEFWSKSLQAKIQRHLCTYPRLFRL